MLIVIALLAAMAEPNCYTLQCLGRYLNEASIVELAEAKDVAGLQRTYRELPYRDVVIDIVYCSRYHELVPGRESDSCLIGAIPRNPLEMEYFDSLGDTECYRGSAAVTRITNAYYDYAADAVIRRNKGMRDMLLLMRFTGGETMEYLEDTMRHLCRGAHSGFVSALRGVDSKTQRKVCGECASKSIPNDLPCDW